MAAYRRIYIYVPNITRTVRKIKNKKVFIDKEVKQWCLVRAPDGVEQLSYFMTEMDRWCYFTKEKPPTHFSLTLHAGIAAAAKDLQEKLRIATVALEGIAYCKTWTINNKPHDLVAAAIKALAAITQENE